MFRYIIQFAADGDASVLWRERLYIILPTLVDKESQLVVDPVRRLQPVQLTEEWSDVVVP